MGQGIQHTGDEFKDSILTFHANKITSDFLSYEVMMDWEDPLMSHHANIVCHNQGDILEIGFGMGIASDYIQSLNPTSHTIVEIHPQIYSNLETWASGKTNVTIYNSDWFDIKDSLGQYDGILYDGVYDINISHFFSTFIPSHIKSNGKFTYFNTYGNQQIYGLTGTTFSAVTVNPPTNSYFNESTYYIPTVQY
jgi:protein arginine N-methyltransferase 2